MEATKGGEGVNEPSWADLSIVELAGELAYWTENPKLQDWEKTVEEIEAELARRDAEMRNQAAEIEKLRAYVEYVEHLKFKYGIDAIERYDQWLNDYALTRGDAADQER